MFVRHCISNGCFEVCSHLNKKASNKGRFLKSEKLQNHNNEGKGEKERARRRKGGGEKNAEVVAPLVFVIAALYAKIPLWR